MTLTAEAAAYAADRWSALGTYAQLVVARADRLRAARAEADQVLSAVDAACSRFRPDSDLVRANRGAGAWVRVDPLLVAALEIAVAAAEDTAGLVDPTLGVALESLGYDRDFADLSRAVDGPPGDSAGDFAGDSVGDSAGDSAGKGPTALPEPTPVRGAWRDLGVDRAGAVRV
ncbi:MAG TPA: FAD:protein FMN transferase, partial [Kineosporiaceae bacterium]|nr:FAD:protein FMN transferase [Kineosporiaceae bacterium]